MVRCAIIKGQNDAWRLFLGVLPDRTWNFQDQAGTIGFGRRLKTYRRIAIQHFLSYMEAGASCKIIPLGSNEPGERCIAVFVPHLTPYIAFPSFSLLLKGRPGLSECAFLPYS